MVLLSSCQNKFDGMKMIDWRIDNANQWNLIKHVCVNQLLIISQLLSLLFIEYFLWKLLHIHFIINMISRNCCKYDEWKLNENSRNNEKYLKKLKFNFKWKSSPIYFILKFTSLIHQCIQTIYNCFQTMLKTIHHLCYLSHNIHKLEKELKKLSNKLNEKNTNINKKIKKKWKLK